ncbi:ABC transporter permease [Microlunatus flavus]|uniref:Oligopeptide transport system permease protein n=1 Tax=Microlunatus flavus TaxID=1036181 RepID=A0A1H9KZJ5_9ACTN|nr:ABC transporter permease [Microlunatus flavus]SER04661.1 oligopeptide transport system permease protein [Microlunatus flavus]
MLKYTGRRLVQFIPVLIGATIICWALVWALPGDPFRGRCGQVACSPQYIQAMTEKYGLDKPLPVQYLVFLKNVFTGNLGQTFSGLEISDVIGRALPVTVRLALISVAIQVVLSAVVGIWSGLRANGAFDVTALFTSLILFSLPIFVVAFIAQYVLGVRLELVKPTVSTAAPTRELILPAAVLAIGTLATLMRILRASVAEGMHADYLRTARAKGFTESRVVGVHLMRNVMAPALNVLGLEFAALLGGTVIVEGIFNIKGVGGLIYRAIQDREQLTVSTVVTLVIVFYLVINLVVDVACAQLDPRSRND